jgi:hypothetical protein
VAGDFNHNALDRLWTKGVRTAQWEQRNPHQKYAKKPAIRAARWMYIQIDESTADISIQRPGHREEAAQFKKGVADGDL